jgi:hypothetical protein
LNAIADVLETVEIVSEQQYDALTVQYLTTKQSRDLNILSFREAIDGGALQVTELDEEGTVPELCFRNTGTFPVFVPEGCIIEGVKQSRFVAVSFIINPNISLPVPVNCVEQLRWDSQGNFGHGSAYHMFSSTRAMNSREVARSLRAGHGYQARKAQSETWASIEKRLVSIGSRSSSRYVGDYYRDSSKKVSTFLRGVVVPDDASGLFASIDDKPVELTLMGSPRLFESHAQGLLNSIAADCIDKGYRMSLRDRQVMTYRQFMVAVIKAKLEKYPSVGVGQDLRFENKELVGSALVNDGKLICLGAYAI